MATSTRKAAPKLNQNDLRRLMKEKQRLKGGVKKIDSPLAKYNNLDQLFCILCNNQIKNELLWPAHVSGKAHKENLEALKTKKQEAEDSSNFKQPLPPPPQLPAKPLQSILKRKAETPPAHSSESLDKRLKGQTPSLPADFFDNAGCVPEGSTTDASAAPSSSLLTMCQQEEAREADVDMPEGSSGKLPADFFDGNGDADDVDEEDGEGDDTETENRLNTVEALPEGFFDDPIVDAKVRKVEYKDPVEEEWEKFQREIADATTKAQAIIEEEEEDSTAERQIDEIEDQIRNWARVDALQRRKEELDVRQRKTEAKSDDQDVIMTDEQEFDEFLDWRAKDCWT